MFEGWADVQDSPFAHYFVEGVMGGCGNWQSLCMQSEVAIPSFEQQNPLCVRCAKVMSGIPDWREYYLRGRRTAYEHYLKTDKS